MPVTHPVNIAVCGKFHILNYIQYLEKAEMLNHIYFSHKKSSGTRFGISDRAGRNFPLKELLVQAHSRLLGQRFIENMYPVYGKIWEASVQRNWSPAPVLHVMANGNSLSIIKRAKKEGSQIVAEVVNTHPQHRKDILIRETEKWGCSGIDTKLLARELKTLEEVALADTILAPTRIVGQSFLNRGLSQPLATIPYAANLSHFYSNDTDTERRRTSKEPLKVVCVGQVGLRKGQFYLLEAVRQLGKSNIDLTLVGSVAPNVAHLLPKYQENFTHVDKIASTQMREFLSGFDVFVLPSLEEGLAVSMCEAMACGLAVITTPEAGGEEIIQDGETGYLVPSTSVDALVERFESLLQDRETLGAVGRRAAEATQRNYNWEQYAVRLQQVYQSLMDGKDVSTN